MTNFVKQTPSTVIYYKIIDTDEIPGFFLLLKNQIFTACSLIHIPTRPCHILYIIIIIIIITIILIIIIIIIIIMMMML